MIASRLAIGTVAGVAARRPRSVAGGDGGSPRIDGLIPFVKDGGRQLGVGDTPPVQPGPDAQRSVGTRARRSRRLEAVGLLWNRGGLLAAGRIGLLVLGTQKLAQLHLVPQDTVETMKENVQWLKEQVTANGRSRSGGQR
jgi:hypothetical protein